MACRVYYNAKNGKRSKLFDLLYDKFGISKAKSMYIDLHTPGFNTWFGNWQQDSITLRNKLDDNREPLYSEIVRYPGFNMPSETLDDIRGDKKIYIESKARRLQNIFIEAGIPVQIRYDSNIPVNAKVEGTEVGGTPTIVFNPKLVKKDTILHEFAHIYIDLLGYDHPLVQNGITQLQGTKLYEEVQRKYADKTKEQIDKEALATAIGREGENVFDNQEQSASFISLIKQLLQELASALGISYNAIQTLTRQLVSGNLETDLSGQLSSYAQEQRDEDYIDKILKDNINSNLKLNETDSENSYYEADGNKLSRLTEFIQKNFSKVPSRRELASAVVDRKFKRENLSREDKIEYENGAKYSFEEMVELEIEQFNTLAAHGKAAHIYLQWVAEENPAKKMALRRQFDDLMLASEGRRQLNPKWFTWIEKLKKDIFEVAGIRLHYVDNNVPVEGQDIVETELSIFDKDLGIGTTIDSLVHHDNGDVSIIDWKAGTAFYKDQSTRREMAYGDQLEIINDSKLNRAKLEIMLRALMLKNRFPGIKFRNLRVVHINERDVARSHDIEINLFLNQIKEWTRDNNPEAFDKFDKKGLFKPEEYGGMPESLVNEEVVLDDKLTLVQKIEYFQAKLNAHIARFSGTDKYDEKYASDLLNKIQNLQKAPGSNLDIDNQDLTMWKRWFGNLYDIKNSRVKLFGRNLFKAKTQARFELQALNDEHDKKFKPVLEEYKQKNALSNTLMRGVKYKDLYGFMWVYRNIEGKTGWYAVTEKDAKWNELTAAQKEYSSWYRITMAEQYKETMSQIISETKTGKAITKAELMGKPKSLEADFIPRPPIKAEEVMEREKTGFFSKKHAKYQLNRVASNYLDVFQYGNPLEERPNYGVPVRFMGHETQIADENHTFSTEVAFKAFMQNIVMKRHMDNIVYQGEALKNYLALKKDSKNQPILSNTISFVEDMMDLHVLNRQREMRFTSKPIKLPFKNSKGENIEVNQDKILRGLKAWTSAASMWLKPVAGTFNHGLIQILNNKDAIKGSVAKRLGIPIDEIDFTFSDLQKGEALYLQLVKDMMLGDVENNKLWNLARKFNYLTDNYDYTVKNRDLKAPKSKLLDKSNLYIFHQIGEDHGTYALLAAQLLHRKHSITGKSIYDSYDNKGNWIGPKRGKIKLADGSFEDLTELDDREIMHLKRVSQRIHGSYRQDERSAMELYALGHWVLQFKKYFPQILNNIFQGRYNDVSLGRYVEIEKKGGESIFEYQERINEGRLWIMLKVFATFAKMRTDSTYKWSNLSGEQKQHVVEVLVTGTMIMTWLAGSSFIDDDDKFWNSQAGQRLTRLLSEDITQGYNPVDILRNIQSQSIVLPRLFQTTEALIDFTLNGVIRGERTQDKHRLPGESMLRKVIPGFSTLAELERYMGNNFSDTEFAGWFGMGEARLR